MPGLLADSPSMSLNRRRVAAPRRVTYLACFVIVSVARSVQSVTRCLASPNAQLFAQSP